MTEAITAAIALLMDLIAVAKSLGLEVEVDKCVAAAKARRAGRAADMSQTDAEIDAILTEPVMK